MAKKNKNWEKLPSNETVFKNDMGSFVKFKRIMGRLDHKLKTEAENRKKRKDKSGK